MKNRIAIVVQRFGSEVLGGAEHHAYIVSSILSSNFDVDVYTSRAKDHTTWSDYYEEGHKTLTNNISIKRFSVEHVRGKYWHKLNGIIHSQIDYDRFVDTRGSFRDDTIEYLRKLPLTFCEHWIRRQGPYCPGLYDDLYENQDAYQYIIFFTYLYATTYFGVDGIKDKRKIRLIPTYHDEPEAYLPLFSKYRNYKHLFSTNAEKVFVESELYRGNFHQKNDVIRYGISLPRTQKNSERKASDYFVYIGRLEENKGYKNLADQFESMSESNPNLKLIVLGRGKLLDYKNSCIDYRGFVSESEKYDILSRAIALIQPSPFESMSIVMLEAFALSVPCIVYDYSKVLVEHIEISKGGLIYHDKDSLLENMNIMSNRSIRNECGTNAYNYFKMYYTYDRYVDTLLTKAFIPKL